MNKDLVMKQKYKNNELVTAEFLEQLGFKKFLLDWYYIDIKNDRFGIDIAANRATWAYSDGNISIIDYPKNINEFYRICFDLGISVDDIRK